jgi:cell wall-associated NlpC family hydrolase
MDGAAVAARARALVGERFRFQGRSSGDGLDCVGLAAAALGLGQVKRDYALRGTELARLDEALEAYGLNRVGSGRAEAGDLMVFRPGPAQLHLAVCTGEAFVQADMALGRVVERPLPAPWPLIALWRVEAAAKQGD